MPTYDYACTRCGPFTARRPLAVFDQPVPCPACGADAARALSVPASLGARRPQTELGQAAERDGAGYQRLRHGGACACCPRA
ncbi:zinc ribbon domain-containing protein [Polaromonas sp. JS666]|uniref:zinc ribbon domain-containing protein n=1 Tax=Polaromonas sp. (strain JS666 / ATCC BAA-500) TaxID=296591 RepID=UPI0000D5B366|nr:zinc ribbon domain-containing protein [Polaromonas sp. JS666]ABE42643.1 putative formamidase regulatory protein FmdB [Polaromonas sp. JS666]